MGFETKTPWYFEGLRFHCRKCGNCCCGPREGYVWLTQIEIESIADTLKISVKQVMQKYCRRVGDRISLIERYDNKNCIFLRDNCCAIYDVRPKQCRTWPFWISSLSTNDAWEKATENCPGINNGCLYSFEEIQKIMG
ncbi:MAG: YkgJ family cysteine cluster protein [Candidatus Ratteibacteria bacterium]|nr:YkgJ family cysteine cluster protein [Candidatus Ratteibacteria bacterium]